MIFALECVQEVIFLVVMFVLVVVGTLVVSRIWPSSDGNDNRVDGTGTNQTRVVKNNKSGCYA